MSKENYEVDIEVNAIGIKYESVDSFKDSYFTNVYRTAYESVQDIIDRNMKFAQPDSLYKNKYNEYTNVLTFIGKRGTGKTSAMLSFMESLKKYDGDENILNPKNFYYGFRQKNLSFTCLDCIDGSLLEKGEDIFQIVLAQMYQKYQLMFEKRTLSQSDDYRTRNLQKKFEQLFSITTDLKKMSHGKMSEGISYISNLRTLASSQKLRADFQELVQEYLSMVQSNDVPSQNQFLVITIDDIDLNIKNGFSMLEEIHRYMMGLHIIVLLALDFAQILKICMSDFYKVLPKVDETLKNGMEYIRGISVDYLDKVLPINYRIYMPDPGSANIKYSLNNTEDGKQRRELILNTIYRKSGVAFDSQGLKMHYYEPKSMRVLGQFFMSMQGLEDVLIFSKENLSDMEKEEIYRKYDRAYAFFKSDLATRMLIENITDDQQIEFLENVMKQKLVRARDLVIDYEKEKNKQNIAINQNIINNQNITINQDIMMNSRNTIKNQDTKDPVYTYGEFIVSLYNLGYIENRKYRALADCILAYFSFEFSKNIINEKYAAKTSEDNWQEIVKQFVGESLADQWEISMFPKVNISVEKTDGVEEDFDRKSSISLPKFFRLPLNTAVTFSSLFRLDLPERQEKDKDNTSIYDFIKYIEILYLSLTAIKIVGAREDEWRENTGGFDWKFNIIERTNGAELSISVITKMKKETTAIYGRFNFFNFVVNSMQAVGRLDKFEKNLVSTLSKYYRVSINRRKLLINEYKNWQKKYPDSLVLPVQWVDMTYNILKRARRNAMEQNPDVMDKEDLFAYIGYVYKNIGNQLQEQEKFYRTAMGYRNNDCKLSEKFLRCPYVKYFLDTGTDQESKIGYFAELAVNLINKEQRLNE